MVFEVCPLVFTPNCIAGLACPDLRDGHVQMDPPSFSADASVTVKYSWAFFMALSHMLCIGYGRYPPLTVSEIWITIFSMVIGASLYAIFIGQISSMTLR